MAYAMMHHIGCFLRGLGGEANGFRSRQADAGRKGNNTEVLGTFVASRSPNWMGPVSGCFTMEPYGYVIHPPVAGPHVEIDTKYSLTLKDVELWNKTNMANEFRPINYAISWCIKAV
jgi:hypothetical protein